MLMPQPYKPKPLPGKSIRTLLMHAPQCNVITVPGCLDRHYVTYQTANNFFGKDTAIQDAVVPEPGSILVLPTIKHMHEYANRFPVVHVLTGASDHEHRKLLRDGFCAGQIAVAVSSAMLDVLIIGSREWQDSIKRIHWLTLGSIGRLSNTLRMNQTPVTFYVHEKQNALESACVKRGLYALGDYDMQNGTVAACDKTKKLTKLTKLSKSDQLGPSIVAIDPTTKIKAAESEARYLETRKALTLKYTQPET